jgi:pentatricopeptide repeat protein
LGHVLVSVEDLDGALAEVASARAMFEGIVAEGSDDVTAHRFLSECELLRGEILADMGRGDEAREAWAHAHEVILPLARDSANGSLLAPLARSLFRLGRVKQAREVVERLQEQGYVDPRVPEIS